MSEAGRRGGDLFEPVRTRRAFEAVVGQVVDRIRAGELREGDLLPGERELASSMQVSRPTVRLALKELAEAGVIEVRPGRGGGARVASVWIPERLLEAGAPEWRAEEIFAVLEARRAVEPRVAQLAALRAGREHFEAMRRAIDLEAAAAEEGDWRKIVQADLLFHRRMWRAAGNPHLERMMRDLGRELIPALEMAMRTTEDRAWAVEIHERTLAALMRGEMPGIEAVMDEHMSYLEIICEDALGRRRVREIPDFLKGRPAR
ncbi:FadR family transcriptional regulator [Rubrobacter taiwanensis]|jgi:GntR family transcriptional repressor for pyruvate dehydrogenase complex|uniref:FadR family transcriptional regulator n=1 Tax=Rubrobacter taiwanensis TaxID=185139 RepID=A0A4R1BR44_9ACTN|nr:FCD domain-containing protein [Rubrobacter taiwanensis]TCJ20101.1 FadR family transcriptional regulator [Rubrobacter taiwanensis]